MKYIDINNWQRKELFNFYKDFEIPHFNLCADIEISNLLSVCKQHNISLFSAMVYLVSKTANDIEAFRMRIRGDKVVLHPVVHPSFTVLDEEQNLTFCDVTFSAEAPQFMQRAEQAIKDTKQSSTLNANADPDASLFMSCLPWVKFSSMSHAMRTPPHQDSVPRFAWGKYEQQENKTMMPLSVQVHHALADGMHVGEYYQRIQQALDNANQIFAPE